MGRSVRLGGHPIHPLLVHFPVALWSMTPLWDTLGLVQAQELWWQFGYWSLAVGLALSLPAMAVGFIDFANIGDNPAAGRAAMRHMMAMSSAACVALIDLLLRHGQSIPSSPLLLLGLSLSCMGLVFIGGWFGGELVYRHGIGRAE
ncbi:MAG: hypothetical protein CVU17_01930 [Betaproteobacteria bacterium HGW-Betaproteobacteria-11]|nr:MAG: hypothetical protein CVU17_01930 [Betaproteobacteria bacterium HGW-Betaproteobacteria-11]